MCCGKSKLINRLVYNEYTPNYVQTIGALLSKLTVQQAKIKFALWDTAGDERYRALTSMYLRSASFCIVCVDLS